MWCACVCVCVPCVCMFIVGVGVGVGVWYVGELCRELIFSIDPNLRVFPKVPWQGTQDYKKLRNKNAKNTSKHEAGPAQA